MIMASIVHLLKVTGCSFKLVYYVIAVVSYSLLSGRPVHSNAILNSLGMWENSAMLQLTHTKLYKISTTLSI